MGHKRDIYGGLTNCQANYIDFNQKGKNKPGREYLRQILVSQWPVKKFVLLIFEETVVH